MYFSSCPECEQVMYAEPSKWPIQYTQSGYVHVSLFSIRLDFDRLYNYTSLYILDKIGSMM